MALKHSITTIALGLAIGLSACGGASPAPDAQQAAEQQFMAERGTAASASPGGGDQSSSDRSIFGSVDQIVGSKMVVKDPFSNTSVTIDVTANTRIRKQVAGQPGDITVGETLTAIGPKRGDIVQAEVIEI